RRRHTTPLVMHRRGRRRASTWRYANHSKRKERSMAEHEVSVVVNAPLRQVYPMFTHFNDFPKFMHFVKEVTYYDDRRSHWVADLLGHHEWDAINEGRVEDRQVGWRSTKGLENAGKVTFQP